MRISALALLFWLLAGCNGSDRESSHGGAVGGATNPPPHTGLAAELTRTAHGVVHIRANNFASLGFGLAYAYAQDNLCMLADSFLTVRGERSRYFGGTAMPTATKGEYSVAIDYLNTHQFNLRNEDSDFFFKAYLDPERLRAGYAGGSPEAAALLAGYAAGYNRYLQQHVNDRPAACRNAAWVKPVTVDDVHLLIAEKALHASGQVFPTGILAAARDEGQNEASFGLDSLGRSTDGPGSNAIALGADATVDGRGLLVANPHYPWYSTDRFYQVHLTIPGVYDVMGVILGGVPIVVIGFNKDVAWTHTVTKARHFTTFRLQLDAADPTGSTYLVDGAPVRMSQRTVEVQSLQPDGALITRRRIFRDTPLGMSMALAGLPLGAGGVLVLGDPNRYNTRPVEQWIAMGKAESVPALQAMLARTMGLPWVNTVAADRHGNAFFGDYSVVPHVTAEKFASDCLLIPSLPTFDGSRQACHWGQDADAPPGIFSGSNAPSLIRRDYVSNSNDGYWLTNSRQLLIGPGSGYSPLYGPVGVPQHLRTRLGFVQLDALLAEHGRLGIDDMEAALFLNRVYAAELILPDLLAGCHGTFDHLLAAACTTLENWDRKVNLDSRGAILFREFWLRVVEIPDKWKVPFDPSDPVHTPRGVAPGAVTPLLAALRAAALQLQALAVPLDAPLGDYQVEVRNGTRYPIHGGIGDVDGVLNAVHMQTGLTAEGYLDVAWGASYIQLVAFDDHGPVARGMLTYGQSTDPASPYYADQLPLYVAKQLFALPFTQKQMQAEGGGQRSTVSER
jgi:acyl-homoserine-lactone acylase